MTSPSEGRVIAGAYVEIRPKLAARFEQDLTTDLDAKASKAGERFGSVLGKGIGAALNPRVQAAVGGAAILIAKFASDQQAAQSRLSSAIESTGGRIDSYTDRIAKAVDAGERLGQGQDKTKSQLAELTLALGSPDKALRELSLAQDIAAGTGRSFTSVAQLLQRANEGQASAYQQLGLKVKDLAGARKAATAAEHDAATAADRVTRAQGAYNDKLEAYRVTAKPTIQQQQALKKSHDDLVDAQAKSAAAAARVVTAQKEVRSAVYDNKAAVTELSDKYKGQAAAGADTFTGHLKSLAAQARDTAGDLVGKYGDAIGTTGTLLLGLSGTVGTVQQAFGRLRTEQVTGAAVGAAATDAAAASEVIALESVGAAATTTGGALAALVAFTGPLAVLAGAAYGLQQLVENTGIADALTTNSKLPGGMQDAATQLARQTADAINAANAAAGQSTLSQQRAAQLQNDLNSDDPKVAARARAQIAAAAATGKATGTAAGKATGDATLQAFLDSINGGKVSGGTLGDALAKSIADAHKKAVANAQKIADDVRSVFDKANHKLRDDIVASLEFQRQIANTVTQGSTLADALAGGRSGALNNIGDRPVGGLGSVAGVKSFLHTRAVQIARFAKALGELRKKGYPAALVQDVAELGTDEGLEAARTLLSASGADVAAINLAEAQIGRAANAVGRNIAGAKYGDTIAADRANTAVLHADLIRVEQQLAALVKQPKTVSVTAKNVGASAAEVGRETGRAVALGMKGM